MSDSISILRKPWETVGYKGVPMFRAQAWALKDAELNGIPVIPYSGDRRYGVAEKYGKSSQKALYDGFVAGKPGYNPANPPGFSSHELKSDGNPLYGPRGSSIPKFKLGLDVVSAPGGDSQRIVNFLNGHGYAAARPYAASNERHHMSFTKDPAENAKKRLRAYYRKKAVKTAKDSAKSAANKTYKRVFRKTKKRVYKAR